MSSTRSVMTGGIVDTVEQGSLADQVGLCPGDVLLAINGHSLRDVLDVQYYAADESLDLLVRRGSGERTYHVEREYGVSLGLGFTAPTFDGMRRCQNKCEFCFVSQMPPRGTNRRGSAATRRLRQSLYVRDDDYRYSVLYGSFITLTGLTSEDWERLEEQRLSPLYVSVHATESALRRQLLGRADAPDILSQIDRLLALRIDVHAQIVLIPGVNDGPHLERSVADLSARYPGVRSIGVVPVGLTRYHRGKCRLYTEQEARAIVAQIAPLQTAYRAQYGASVVYLADEWYLVSGLDVPPEAEYDDYPQVENGIGLVRQFLEDSYRLQVSRPRSGAKSCTLVCGTSIAPIMKRVAGELAEKSGSRIEVVPVVNQLFGETVTVSGLLGGEDVLRALAERGALGEVVFLPRAMFAQPPACGQGRDGREVLVTLDDLAPRDFEDRLGRPVERVSYISEVCQRLGGRT